MWCRERESNPYGALAPRDFKSRASANFATPAEFSSPRLWSTLNCLNSISHKSYFVNTLLRKNIDFFWFSEYNILVSLIFIILYSDFIRFMHRNFNPIIEESYPPFFEDVYIVDARGNVITCRQSKRRRFNNIFDVIIKDELPFIKANMAFASLHPFILVDSIYGLMLLNFSIYDQKRIFMAIIPHLSTLSIINVVKSECDYVLISPLIQNDIKLRTVKKLTDEQKDFASRLKVISRVELYYQRLRGMTNVEIADMMTDILYDISNFVGCKLDCEFHGIGIFELKNELCVYSYVYMLTILCFAVRNYSLNQKAKADIFFDEYGISLRISLMNAEACEKKKSVLESPELIYLAKGDKKVQFLIENSTSDAVLSVCGYLWQNQFDDKHIKKKSTELKYDKK